ncbi:4-hydroxy-tetrahydrodipicolinate synthase [Salinibacillus xinjiangensis]|uniref:4-hydroxy-tetrahydrodipicolinate synthase n=1 Tax=Salinibacillus xinjiangensis TaxID=1229268 RepID=A0A6G1X204_9BACI|nr:4-hydroxy-tetrahydrodipicolinate synthase [Salinibacillus xinjiangensis]MRG85013.1 4-hydroxy-tetrahydrodipicolinate synthase [Salinibacillus xinjiangensis]
MNKVSGIYTAMLTPFKDDYTIDEVATRNLVNHLIDRGVDGLFILGTNGEFFSMSHEEKVHFAKIVVNEVKGRVSVCAGTGAISTDEVIMLTKDMETIGIDIVSVLTPYLMTISQQELTSHYTKVAESTNLPILMYHMPGRTNNELQPETVKELSRIPNIVGIKDSTGDFNQILKYIEITDEDFSVLSGADPLILWTLLAGGKGAIAASSNMVPELVVSIYKHWKNGEIQKAYDAQQKLRMLREASSMASTPAVFKKAMELLGIPVGPPRLPVKEIPKDVENKIIEILKHY